MVAMRWRFDSAEGDEPMARLTIWLLGFEVFAISNEDEAEDDAAALAGGTLGSTAVGFTARWELPDGAKRPEWEDE